MQFFLNSTSDFMFSNNTRLENWQFEYMCFKIVCRASTMPCIAFKRQKGKIIPLEQKMTVKRKYEHLRARTIFCVCFILKKNILSPVGRHLTKHPLQCPVCPLRTLSAAFKRLRSIIIPLSHKNAVERKYERPTAMSFFNRHVP